MPKGSRRWLVYGGNNDKLLEALDFHFHLCCEGFTGTCIVSPSDGFDVAADFIAECRVEATRRLVKKKNLGVCHETACYSKSLLLAATESLLDGCPDNGMLLRVKAEAADEVVDTLQCLFLRHLATDLSAKM